MLFRMLLVATVLSLGPSILSAEGVLLRDLFEVETTQVTQLSGFGVAIHPKAILESESRPTNQELARFLTQVSGTGLGDNLPGWLDQQKHTVAVRVSVAIPDGGASAGEQLDCHVTSLNGSSTEGLLLAPVALQSLHGTHTPDGKPFGTARGMVDSTGHITEGAQLTTDCLEHFTGSDLAEPTITLRLRADYEWGEDAQVMSDTMERIRSDLRGYYNTEPPSGSPTTALGIRRFELRVPSTYRNDIVQFAYEIGEKLVHTPPQVERAETTAKGEFAFDSDDQYLQSREQLQCSYRQQILSGLSYIPGVKVEVSAELEQVKGSSPPNYKPRELHASIAVPRKHVIDVWRQNNPESDRAKLTDAELAAIKKAVKIDIERFVQNILPRLAIGEDEYKQIEVIFYDDVSQVRSSSKPADYPVGRRAMPLQDATISAPRRWNAAELEGQLQAALRHMRGAKVVVNAEAMKNPDAEASVVRVGIPRSYIRLAMHESAIGRGLQGATESELKEFEESLVAEIERFVPKLLREYIDVKRSENLVEVVFVER